MKDKTYIGIDPGSSSGAIAFISIVNDMEFTYYMEFGKYTTQEWLSTLREYAIEDDCRAILEKVHGFPGMNVSAVSALMKNYGNIEMALIALRIPFKEVTPQTWMKYYNLKRAKDESKTEWKRRLREHLQRIMPEFKVTNNNADAMLIAKYCKDNEGK